MRPFLTLHDPARAQGFYAAGLWRDETFYTLLARHAGTRPGAIALRDGRQTLDWESLKARVDAMADDLLDNGLVAGDRVAIWMSNRVEAVIAFLACAREGLACNPSLHRSYTCGEIVTLLDSIGASALVTEPGWGADRPDKDFAAMVGAVGTIRRVYTPADWPLCITRAPRAHRGNPDAVAYLAFTSGTTGRPKCVMHSSNTLLANARELARDWMLDDGSVILSLSPLSHHIAWVAIGQWLVCGGQMVTDDPPPGTSRLDWIVAVGATYVLGVPTHAMELLAEQRRRDIARLGVVRTFYMAGAPIPEIVAQGFVDQGIAPQNIYGMTECSSHQYTHPDDPVATWVATCGRGGSAYEVRIWDPADADREMRPGETGEIGGRGACLMLGYYANQAATDASFNRHGYLMSGDLGSFDGNGNLRIEGRTKDVVIRGGHNIHPARIEALALTHPAVEKAAAFGVADARLGEKVCLAIVGAVDADAMLDHLGAEELSKFDMPEWFVALDAMPLTASGKILKRELAAMVARGDIAPRPVRYAAKTGNMDTGSMTTGSMA